MVLLINSISIYHNILLYQNGKTATYEALKIARDIIFTPGGGDRAGIQDIIILVTDGQPNPLPADFMELVDDIKRRGVEIIGLGVAEADDELMWEVRMCTVSSHIVETQKVECHLVADY